VRRRGTAVLVLAATCALSAPPSLAAGVHDRAAADGRPQAAATLAQVARARRWVAAGVRLHTLPRALGAQLGGEPLSWLTGNACLDASTNRRPVPCILGDRHATQALVLIGDSFAVQWGLAFDQLGRKLHFKVIAFVRRACPFASIGVARVFSTPLDYGCVRYRNRVLNEVNALRGSVQILVAAEARDVYNQPNGKPFKNAAWSAAVTKTLDTIRLPGLLKVVLHGVPTALASPAECLSAYPTQLQRCLTPVSSAFPGGFDGAEVLGAQRAHAAIVGLTRLFCTTSLCPDVANDELVHADQEHVNRHFALSLDLALGELLGCTATEASPSQPATRGILARLNGGPVTRSLRRSCRALR
jgi:hypothetical protein